MPELSIRNLVVEHRSNGHVVRALDKLDAEASDGELVLVVGPSGCGKTTLLSCLGGILRPTSGTLAIDGEDLRSLSDADLVEYRRRSVGFVFQAFNLVPSLTARENVAAPLFMTGWTRRDAFARADELLAQVGMGERARHKPSQLSGGQQQRVAVARGLAAGPPLLIADEPTANLDFVQAEAVISLLRDLAEPGRSVIVSTHDDRLLPIADRVVDLTPRIDADDAASGRLVLEAGATAFRQGERGPLVYMVVEGLVEIVREEDDGIEVLAHRGPGTYFGELGPMMGQPRSATARAAEPTVLEAMTLQDFREQRRHAVAPSRNGNTPHPA